MEMSAWKRAIAAIFVTLLSWLGIQAQSGAAQTSQPETAAETLAQSCSDPQDYARVTTESTPLNVRSKPGGAVIGAIPRNWAVIVQGKDSTGRWTRVTSHFGDIGEYGFASAPNFRTGWVATRYLRPLGKFCQKPEPVGNLEQSNPNALNDWNLLGDAIARSANSVDPR